MIGRLLGSGTPVPELKSGLDDTTAALRGVAHRVANASTPDVRSFGEVFGEVGAPDAPPSLEEEMITLADEQLRFETTSRVLQKIYQMTRTAVGGGA